jgi:hypothetical protein
MLPDLDGDVVERIALDVSLGVPIEASTIAYDETMTEYRRCIERWIVDDPDAILDLPYDVSSPNT